MSALLLAQVVTSLLVIVVWLAQWYWYPAFIRVAPANFPDRHARHVGQVVPMTAPLMLVEAALFFLWHQSTDACGTSWLAGIPLLIVWINTFLLQIPRHLSLSRRKSDDLIRGLLRSNRYRALAWTLYAIWLWSGRPWPPC